MQGNILTKEYETWTDFKKDVEKAIGHYLPNNLWLQAKPRKPLPWTEIDMKATISYVKKTDYCY